MKIKTKIVLLFILVNFIAGSFVFLNTSAQTLGSNDEAIYFVPAEIDITEENITNGLYYNLGNPYIYSAIYNSTYTFTDEIGEVGANIDFITTDNSGTGCHIEVESPILEHHAVIEYYDYSATQSADSESEFSSGQSSGVIELYTACTHTNKRTYFELRDSGDSIIFRFLIYEDGYLYFSNAGGFEGDYPYSASVWSHISLDFDCVAETYNVMLNGIEVYEDLDFTNSPIDDEITYIYINTLNTATDFKTWFDAIGYSWDTYYNEKDNYYPTYDINTSILEPQYDEFNFEGYDDLYDSAETEPLGYESITIGSGGNEASIDSYGETYPLWDNTYWFNLYGAYPSSKYGFEKDFNEDADRVNISVIMSVDSIDDNGFMNWTICSKDETPIAELYINKTQEPYEANMRCDFYWVDGSSKTMFIEDEALKEYHQFDIFIDYYSEVVILKFDGGSYMNTLLTYGKQGIGTVKFQGQVATAGLIQPYFDAVGVFIDGNSLAVDMGFIDADMNKTMTYNRQRNYLFNGTMNGKFTIAMCETNGTEYTPEFSDSYIVANETTWSNETVFYNMVGLNAGQGTSIINTTAVLFFNDTTEYFDFTRLNLFGCYISRNWTIDYSFVWDRYYDSININETYIWADEDYNLQFQYISRDAGNEMLQLSCVMSPTLATDKAIRFTGYMNCSTATGFRLDYTSGGGGQIIYPSGIALTLDATTRTYAYSMDEGRFWYMLYIRFYDSDAVALQPSSIKSSYVSHENITTRGYISYLTILYLPDLSLTYSPIALAYAMIPIVILIAPSFKLRQRYGNGALLPMFFLMALICVITQIIPYWVFFIIVLGFAVFIFRKQQQRRRVS